MTKCSPCFKVLIFTIRKRSFGQGNVFYTCLLFCSQGRLCQGVLESLDIDPPRKTSGQTPPGQTPFWTETLPWAETPRTKTPYGKERAVRILLECILVLAYFWKTLRYFEKEREPLYCVKIRSYFYCPFRIRFHFRSVCTNPNKCPLGKRTP